MNGMLNGKLVSSELSIRYFLCGGHTLKHSAELETENWKLSLNPYNATG